jgi:nickel/cobalt transporter (NicO) family protein
MKKLALLILVATASAFVLVPSANAHPLGNFTINTFSRVQVSGDRVYVRYVLDMAEIPTFQAGHIDARSYANRLSAGAHLTVNGHAARLVATKHVLAHPKGAGGLHTTRLEVILRGPAIHGAARIGYHDGNYANRIGWHEIVVGPDAKSRSEELRAYPKDLLSSPLNVRSAAATVAPTSDPPPALTQGNALQAPDRVADSGFASLIVHDHLSAGFIAL